MPSAKTGYDIESALAQLMPRAMSSETQCQLEEVIDDLVDEHAGKVSRRTSSHWPRNAVAAVLFCGFVGAGMHLFTGQLSNEQKTVATVSADSVGTQLLAKRVWIDGGEDLGVLSVDDSGDARQGWSYVGVEEERVLHSDSGYEVILQREFEGEHYALTTL